MTHDARAALIAEQVMASDQVAKSLKMRLVSAAVGRAQVAMVLREDMTQGHQTGHGGVLFSLADVAFAIACNSHNERAVAQQCSIAYLAPAQVGDRLVADAVERRQQGRTRIVDVTVSRADDGSVLAEFRGHSRTIGGVWIKAGNEHAHLQKNEQDAAPGHEARGV